VLKAVNGVELELRPGETLGVVGESGCGKSTLARAVYCGWSGDHRAGHLLGEDITGKDKKAMRVHRRDMQVIFQDPLASLNPRMTVGDIVAEPLWTHFPAMPRREVRQKVEAILGGSDWARNTSTATRTSSPAASASASASPARWCSSRGW
jgi:ABC-type microcin C transport system duplicated ATPase subunit YejF